MDTFRAGLVVTERRIVTAVRILAQHLSHITAVCRANHVVLHLFGLLHRCPVIHPAGLRLLFLREMLCKLALQRVFFFRCPIAAFRTLFGLCIEPRLNLAVLPCVHLSGALVEVFRRLCALCKAHAVIEISVIIRGKLRILCNLLRHKAGNLVGHLVLRGLHRTFPNRSFRQLKRRLQLAVELYKLLHLIVVVCISGLHTLRICCRSRTDRTRRTKHQAAERTACGALGQLRKRKLCVRIVCRQIRNIVEEITCAFLCRFSTHLPQDILHSICAAGMEDLAHLLKRQFLCSSLNNAGNRAARERFACSLSLLIQFKRALTGRLHARHHRSDYRTNSRNSTHCHCRQIACNRNSLIRQPARRRCQTGLCVRLCLTGFTQHSLAPFVGVNPAAYLYLVFALPYILKLIVHRLIVRRDFAVCILTAHIGKLQFQLLFLFDEPIVFVVFQAVVAIGDVLLCRVNI